jgi:hypothetical protein
MLKENADSGEGISFAKFPRLDSERDLLSAIDEHIGHAQGPTAAFRLMDQKRVLEDRLRFKQWLEQSRAFSVVEPKREAPLYPEATQQLMRRVSWAITR